MKISTFFLSVSAFSVLYLCYADWIDDLIDSIAEEYLGIDYEEVAPFIPSVPSDAANEFDAIVEEFSKPPKNRIGSQSILLGCLVSSIVLLLLARSIPIGKCLELIKQGRRYALHSSWNRPKSTKPSNKRVRWNSRRRIDEDVPVQVIWKGNGLMESSVHCNLKERIHGIGAGDVTGSGSNDCTVRKLSEMRKMLESDVEMTDHSVGTEDVPKNDETGSCGSVAISAESISTGKDGGGGGGGREEKEFPGDPKLMNRIRILESRLRLEELKNRNWINRMSRAEGILQQLNKQVERIERSRPIEATALLETFKITRNVTNWMSATTTATATATTTTGPRRNLELTLVKEFPVKRGESLADYIKRELVTIYDSNTICQQPEVLHSTRDPHPVAFELAEALTDLQPQLGHWFNRSSAASIVTTTCMQHQDNFSTCPSPVWKISLLPCPYPGSKQFISLPKPPLLRALPSPAVAPQSSILSKFLSK